MSEKKRLRADLIPSFLKWWTERGTNCAEAIKRDGITDDKVLAAVSLDGVTNEIARKLMPYVWHANRSGVQNA